jgi:hypothetical protein
MSYGPEILGDGWRDIDIPGLGPVQVRRAVMRDLTSAGGSHYWWIACVRCVDGSPLLPPDVAAADIRADIGQAILAEVMRDRPTAGLSAVSGA